MRKEARRSREWYPPDESKVMNARIDYSIGFNAEDMAELDALTMDDITDMMADNAICAQRDADEAAIDYCCAGY